MECGMMIEDPTRRTFWDYCRRDPSRIALIEVGGHRWSRGALRAAAAHLERQLQQCGVAEGHAVAVLAPNCAAFLIAYLAITRLGACPVPVNYHLTGNEIEHVLRLSRVRVVISHPHMADKTSRLIEKLDAPRPQLIVLDEKCGTVPDEDLQEPALDAVSSPASMLGRPILFTSASSGKPKAVVYPAGQGGPTLQKMIEFRVSVGTLCDSDVVHLCASMLYHTGPLEGAAITLHMGNTVVLMPSWDMHTALQAIALHRVTHAFLVPIMIVQLSKLPVSERAGYDLSSLRSVMHAGSPCPRDAKMALIDWFGPIVCESYGATEGGGTFVTTPEWLQRPGTVGRAIPGSVISIRDASGNALPPGQAGSIYIQPYTQQRFAYLDDPDSTARCYIGDQFTVGDIGYLDDEGYLFVLDRAIHLILSGGANIYPAEIEAVLSCHPLVADCAVVGRPHAQLGEVVHAMVQPSAACSLTDGQLRADLIRFASRRLAPGKLPRTYEFVAALPRDPNGKMLKRNLHQTSMPAAGNSTPAT